MPFKQPSLFQPSQLMQIAAKELASEVTHVFITGAGGFLGKAICCVLRAAGIKVTGFARSDYPELSKMGVTMIKGDICSPAALLDAMQGCDLVFHVASKAGVWGAKSDYYQPNVEGTKHVIESCKTLRINRLVYTSTPSVTFAGVDEEGIDESQPYAQKYLNYYAQTKAIAEQMVLKANSDTLKTLALRPHLIWGPDDPHLVPRVIQRAKAGRLKLVGKQDKLVDSIYIDNAAYSHILAALSLTRSAAVCGGKAYFISNDQPMTMANMLNKILACVNIAPVTKRVPASIAYAMGSALESIYLALGKKNEPIMTRFVARQLSTCHYYNIDAAKKDLNYRAIISIDEGMARLKVSLNKR
ncbi:MAG: NAD-dependent epimerase/dehydratase family protein [Colwellia sp.]|nr:NAD-dependent epimerase/dehydratase family protein [Colwellia sp.]